MKLKLKLGFLSVSIIFLSITALTFLTKCYKCSSCVASNDSFDLPYESNQTVSYVNDSSVTVNYTVSIQMNLPPSEYCGPVGSESYEKCSGDESATFINSQNNAAHIKIYYNTNGSSDGIELPVYKNIVINNSSLIIVGNNISTPESGSSVQVFASAIVNGVSYNDVFEFTRDSSISPLDRCVYFLYSKSAGILKFNIKKTNYIEKWILKKS